MIRRIVVALTGAVASVALLAGPLAPMASARNYVPWSFHLRADYPYNSYIVRNQIGPWAEPYIKAYVDYYNAWLVEFDSEIRLNYVYGGTGACLDYGKSNEILFCGGSNLPNDADGLTETYWHGMNQYDQAHFDSAKIWINLGSMPSSDVYETYHTFGHELGHAFNVQHLSDINDLMCPRVECRAIVFSYADAYALLGKLHEHGAITV